jgi:F-type H+-transporting ATPase subunit gamma
MASLKEVRIRIASVMSTQQITKAMKMVSAAKFRRAQDAIHRMRPYATKLREILSNLSGSMEGSAGAYAKMRPVKKVLLVAVSSNRGLCGGFNANVIRSINRHISEHYREQMKEGNVKVLCIGKKMSDYFSRNKNVYAGNHNTIYQHLRFEDAAAIADTIIKEFTAGNFDKVELVYNHFKNAAVQNVVIEQYLPVQPPPKPQQNKKITHDFIFEPGKEEILADLIPKGIRTQLYKALLESHAGEHGARMTAMNKATDNAGELLRELRLSYNKARQAAITGEILEIVAGAEALK